MIIISNKPGQLGNLIFIYANFLAYGIENNVIIRNPAFYEYKSYFTGSSSFSGSRLFYRFCYFISRVLFKLKIRTGFITVIALNWDETIDLENAPQLKSNFCFVQGWLFRSNKLVIKHKQKIVNFFTPTTFFKNKLDSFFTQFTKNETIIGVHIRHGDYKTFEDGKYFYSIEKYIEIIKNLAVLFENTNPHFLICSNEKVNLHFKNTQGLKITYAPGHELLDMYCLANCNYIVGPPSTYSMWASFYGNVPLYIVNDTNKKIEVTDFKINLSS
ncbi:MAG: alpha-1,2-fucosyltransferase [Bacteroidota bacterium]|nr:alpha-1,2-fucosyltransferase [Bacteroidota bacterium]